MNYKKIVKKERSKLLLENYEDLINNINDDIYKIKIQNFIERFDLNLTINDIIDKIKSDKIFAYFFIKDPIKQNIYEKCQLKYIKQYYYK